MKNAQILNLQHARKKKKRSRKQVNIDGVKYFTDKEIKLLRRTARKDSYLAMQKNQATGVRAWIHRRVRNWIRYYEGDIPEAFNESQILLKACEENTYIYNDVMKDTEIFKSELKV